MSFPRGPFYYSLQSADGGQHWSYLITGADGFRGEGHGYPTRTKALVGCVDHLRTLDGAAYPSVLAPPHRADGSPGGWDFDWITEEVEMAEFQLRPDGQGYEPRPQPRKEPS